MASEPDRWSAVHGELAALSRALVEAERARQHRFEQRLAELDAEMREAARIQQLIVGGASRREARLRALEDSVEAMAAERARRSSSPRPLDLPERGRFDPSVVDMRPADRDAPGEPPPD